MNSAIEHMLASYEPVNAFDRKNAAKEVIQEIVLCGLSRAGFFDKAAFYGGTALRIFYGLDRFSEDLDFSLMEPDEGFDLARYLDAVQSEARSFGVNAEVRMKEKTGESDIQSAFLKGNTREHLLLFYPHDGPWSGVPADEKLKVKFEIDVNPPAGAGFSRAFRLLPAPYEINLYDEPSLFAGKIHAVLCRGWKNRVKGRDLYDYLFYLGRGTPVNLAHLRARMEQTGSLSDGVLELGDLQALLQDRFSVIDFKEARRDVEPFLADRRSLDLWSVDFFCQVTNGLRESRSVS
ncbi:nucleotidyl transferase AbiEii/AbiGii toxin family protein [Adlercreutzia sp. R25]|uniref:Nucleotidyl transferase AbiEii/AbiGii toxin family protein n=1 Tax=Adlercreutzia shanghongiae TaxID=3111773 RepID=A0ABU6IXT5_9ACTN|nr:MULTISPECIES: nucleotidyl transferase AbiEii/AbiGii toxin family protein [unclassified Adlercreutzia]MEC4272688.1 nucleotidyl transferase AbiEii/AbiGii toxin family protein [Adlercreutzia sp. R25]MEC4294412.1 nucleotidyl transferase AbiEii/AbiGii toxin family protein [Adlercreutzia sp. R22]